MINSRKYLFMILGLACLIGLGLAASQFTLQAQGQDPKGSKASLTVEQTISSIRTAIVAKPGNVRSVEVEFETGKTICEVVILAQDGKTYEVEVDVASNTVVEIEEDDDEDDDDDGVK